MALQIDFYLADARSILLTVYSADLLIVAIAPTEFISPRELRWEQQIF
ncbi:MAG: hypothetical protein ACFCBU_02320 [Cyanophyceae cyanobacterium]